jgi:hypothetical protein
MRKGALFKEVLEFDLVEDIVHDARQPGAHFRLFAVTDRLDEEIPESTALEMKLAQDIEDATPEGLAPLVKLFEETAINVALTRFLGHKGRGGLQNTTSSSTSTANGICS